MVATTREVIFKLTTEQAAGLDAGFKDVAAKARATQAEIRKENRITAVDYQKILAEKTALRKQAEAAEERDRVAAVRAGQAASREKIRMAAEEASARAQAAAKTRQVEQQAQTAAENFNRSLTALATSRQGLISGGMGLARSMAYLFASNSKDAQKLIQSLMVIQGVYGGLRNSQQIVGGLVDVWKRYKEAVAAAAVAQAAAGATQGAAGAAGGIAPTVGKVAPLVTPTMWIAGSALAVAAISYAIYKGFTMGLQRVAAEAEAHTNRMLAGRAALKEAMASGAGFEARQGEAEEGIAGIGRSRTQAIFEATLAKSQRALSARDSNLAELTRDWSANKADQVIGKHEPGVAGYNAYEAEMTTQRAMGAGVVGQHQANVARAAQEVEAKKAALAAAKSKTEALHETAIIAQSTADKAEKAASEQRWYQRSFGGLETDKLRQRAEGTRIQATQAGETAGVARNAEAQANQAVEDSITRRKAATEQLSAVEQAEMQRNIQNAETFIGKLREMKEAHLRNAEAIDKAGDALAAQMYGSVGGRREGRRLTRAMRRVQAGGGRDKDLALLAGASAPEQAEALQEQIRRRHPEQEALLNFLGKGRSAETAEKAKAAEEAKRIKAGEAYVTGAKENALRAADVMTDKLAGLLKDLFDAQERRFVQALEKLKSDWGTRNTSTNAQNQ